MDEQDSADGQLHFALGFFLERLLKPSQRGAGAGDPRIAGGGIFLKGQAAAKAARETTGEKSIQELAVVKSTDTQAGWRMSSRYHRGRAHSSPRRIGD